ncbi:unnamed protein product [Ilex paraguariensis]|uniref:DUF4378 domain-containing protein n=1 Tax=Ilex paraguariensis TaxID=185542 RepID=A0ABC8SPI1_9AQUA
METRSPKLPAIREKNQLSCMWGLLSIFYFRQDHHNQKWISNGRNANKHGAENSRSKVNVLTNSHEKCRCIDGRENIKTPVADDGERSVKKLIEEEMFIDKQIMCSELQHIQSKSGFFGHLAKNHKKASKTSQKAYRLPVGHLKDAASVEHQHHSHTRSEEMSLDKHMAALLEAFYNQIHQNKGRYDSGVQRGVTSANYDQQDVINWSLVGTSAETFIDRMFIDRKLHPKDESSHESKYEHLSDALEVLNSNRELFLKLLHDPNSVLVRRIQTLQYSQPEKEPSNSFQECKIPESKISDVKQCERPVDIRQIRKRNVHDFFWKMIKSSSGYPSKGRDTPRSSSTMVDLKSAPKNMQNSEVVTCNCSSLLYHHSVRNKGQIIKPTYFSFREIKRKLKHAMGEKRKGKQMIPTYGTSPSANQVLKDNRQGIDQDSGRGRTVKIPTDVNREYRICKVRDMKSSIGHQQKEFDILLEAKKHLSERLRKVKCETFSSKQAPITMGRILLSPECDLLPALSPKKGWEYGSVSSEMRFSLCSLQLTSENSLQQKETKTSWSSPLRQKDICLPYADCGKHDYELHICEQKPNYLENIFPDTEIHKNIHSHRDDLSHSGYAKIVETKGITQLEDLSTLEVPSEPNSMHFTRTRQGTNAAKLHEENGYPECSTPYFSPEIWPVKSPFDGSSSSPLTIHQVEVVESSKDREDHPSPVSVLEPFLTDDVTSPTSPMLNLAAEPPVQLHIDFEEHSNEVSHLGPKMNLSACLEDQEFISARVRTVLQASCLNWEELSVTGDLSEQLLNPSLHNEAELFPDELSCDHKLLFDCIDEVVLEIHQRHFGCSPWMSFLNPKLGPVSLEGNVVEEVMEEVNWHLFTQTMSRTLDQIVGKDITKSGTWVDIRLDSEVIATKIADNVVEESIMDVVLEVQSRSLS